MIIIVNFITSKILFNKDNILKRKCNLIYFYKYYPLISKNNLIVLLKYH